MNIKDIQINGTNFSIHGKFKSFITDKCQKLLDHSNDILHLSFELTRCSKNKCNEVKCHLHYKGKAISFKSSNQCFKKAADKTINKADRSLRRKSRLEKIKRHLGFK
jgi:ribosomal subunit interface protein